MHSLSISPGIPGPNTEKRGEREKGRSGKGEKKKKKTEAKYHLWS